MATDMEQAEATVPIEVPTGSGDGDEGKVELAEHYSPRYLSPSSASSYNECARRWKFRYVDRLPDPPGEAAVTGSFAHLVLEKLMQEPKANRTVDRAKELARELWPEMEADPDYEALELDERKGLDFRIKGWNAIEGLWDLEDPSQVEVLSTEQNVQVEINGVPFRGIIDRVEQTEDGVVVTDYKSGRVPDERYVSKYTTQMLLYAAALTELQGHQPIKAQLMYLGQKVVEVELTEETLGEAVNELRTTYLAVMDSCMTQTFEASVGPLCGWCPFVTECPEGTAEVMRRHEAGMMRTDAPALALIAASS